MAEKFDAKSYIEILAKKVKKASSSIASAPTKEKNCVLNKMADLLEERMDEIISANEKDIKWAKENNLSSVMIDRLLLNEKRIKSMATSLREIAALKDPVGQVISAWRNQDDLWIHKVRVPIGIVGIIYESRPNVTSDCIGLCLKSGNAAILRGGKEAINSNMAIFKILKSALLDSSIDPDCIALIEFTDREIVKHMLRLSEYIDLIIPRGGEGLIRFVMENSLIPVIKHYKGVCHEYVDASADIDMALRICHNAKVNRPGVCNAVEKILVHKDIAKGFLPKLKEVFDKSGVEIRGCPLACKIIDCKEASDSDWKEEYLDLIVAIKIVDNLSDAIDWINSYGSHHSDGIITSDYKNAMEFVRKVDSSAVYVNASTRFTDGGVFGLGAEIGISTDRLHARGPMGVEELTTYKYVVFGEGQIRE